MLLLEEPLKTLFHWAVVAPAHVVAWVLFVAAGFALLFLVGLTWRWIVATLDGPLAPSEAFGRPRRFSTTVIALVVALYVGIVAFYAVYRVLPEVLLHYPTADDEVDTRDW